MQAADDARLRSAMLEKAIALFELTPVPEPHDLLEPARVPTTSEVAKFVEGRTWADIARSGTLQGFGDSDIDLGEITRSLSCPALNYYLPGLLIHFFFAGTYKDSIWGPNFFYNLIRRLQPDFPDVAEVGGCDAYFVYSAAQRRFCAQLLKAIYVKFGDEYEETENRGYEWQDVASRSLARALNRYWGQYT